MGSTGLRYLKTNPQIIFFTDFDGTITLHDSECPATRAEMTMANHIQAMTLWYSPSPSPSTAITDRIDR